MFMRIVTTPDRWRSPPQRVLTVALLILAVVAHTPLSYGQENERYDDPSESSRFRQQLLVNDAGEIPQNVLSETREHVDQLRQAVAARAEKPSLALAKGAARGISVRVGGIPVGPLPVVSPSRQPFLPINAIRDLPEPQRQQMQSESHPLLLPLSTPLNPQDWMWLGPDHVGGRTRAIVIHPDNPHRMWLAGITGGIWRSDNGGSSWAPLNDFMANLVVSCMVLDPTNPDVLYAGTGEGFVTQFGLRGFGIFKSTDAGLTWTHLPATTTADFQWVNRLAISPDGATLLAGTRVALFRSCDGGGTFIRVAQPLIQGTDLEVLDIRYHPTDAQKCVMAGRRGKTLYSTDGGQTVHAAQGIPALGDFRNGRVELTYVAANPNIVLASVDYNRGELYRSTDGGATYTLHSQPRHLGPQGWFDNTIWAGDEDDGQLVVMGGIDLYRSTNGGRSFQQISNWTRPNSLHADQHIIVAHPAYDRNNNRTVYVGNDGGIYRTSDILAPAPGWMSLNNGLGITQFYGAAGSLRTGQIIGGTQDNGTLLSTPSSGRHAFRNVLDGDGGCAAVDSAHDLFYGARQFLKVHRLQSGASIEDISGGIADAGRESSALFVAPFVLDPNDGNRLLAGGSRLWRTTQARRRGIPGWSQIKAASSADNRISAIAIAAGDSNLVWIGYEGAHTGGSGAVYRSDNATRSQPSWTRMGQNTLPSRHCTRLTIDPGDHQTVYAAFSGYAQHNLWVTRDGGATWNSIGGGILPDVPVYDVAIHPQDSAVLIVGTEVGLLVSGDGGATWYPTNHGPTNCAVFQLFWMRTTLVAVTYGRGLFQIDLGQRAASWSAGALEGLPEE